MTIFQLIHYERIDDQLILDHRYGKFKFNFYVFFLGLVVDCKFPFYWSQVRIPYELANFSHIFFRGIFLQFKVPTSSHS